MKKKVYILLSILVTILLFGLILLEVYNMFSNPKNELPFNDIVVKEDEIDLFLNNIDLDTKRKEYNNDDIIGRLEIPGLFNLLITKYKDNDYYLNHNIYKKKDIKGTEFVDFRNDADDKNINIYGHNSRTYELPFRKLEKYLNEDFFNNNKYIIFQTDKGDRLYEVVALKKVTTDYEHMNIETKNQMEHIDKLLDNTIYLNDLNYDEKTNVIVLQTCEMEDKNSFYLLIGFEIEK